MDTVTVGKLSGQYARRHNVLGKARYKGHLTRVSRTSRQEKGLEKQSVTSGTWSFGNTKVCLMPQADASWWDLYVKALRTKLDSEVTRENHPFLTLLEGGQQTISVLGGYVFLKRKKKCTACPWMFIAKLFIAVKNWKQAKCPTDKHAEGANSSKGVPGGCWNQNKTGNLLLLCRDGSMHIAVLGKGQRLYK